MTTSRSLTRARDGRRCANPNAGDVLVSAAPGYEFTDLAGRHHAGGGSHGSLLAGDSEVPMLTIGLEPIPGEHHRDRAAPARRSSAWSASATRGLTPCLTARKTRRLMVEQQLRSRDIADERVLDAMERVPRELFVPEALRDRAYDDAALPIGAGQTISQPYMVARICEALALHGGERVLDVGTGSGYQAAVLAELADEVHTIERLPELAEARARASPRPGTTGSTSTSATGRSACPSTRRSTRSPSPPPRRELRRASTSSSSRAGGSSCPSASATASSSSWSSQPRGAGDVRSVPCRFVPLLGEEGFAV